MKRSLILFTSVMLMTACGGDDAEKQGARLLQQSRAALAQKNYAAARDSILSLRRNYPTAIEARKQALLLLDSIEMLAAKDSLVVADSADWERLDVKAKFYERKLLEDQKE